MPRYAKVLIAVVFSFLFCCTCVGYAQLTDTLSVSGSASAEPPEGVYITEVEYVSSTSGMSTRDATHKSLTTTVDCAIKGSRNSSVTYAITVFNNTSYTYAYAGLSYVSSYQNNNYINNGISVVTKDKATDSSGTFNTSDIVPPRQSVTFYATYTITGWGLQNRNLSTSINYKFAVNVDSVGKVAIDAALIQFGEILNDTSAGGGYETLIEKIDDKYNGADWSANFIGNVVGAVGIGQAGRVDTETITNLFEGKLQITIDGVETNVTVLIKREDVDGNTQTGDDYVATYGNSTTRGTGCEMTLYLTTADLSRSGASVPVYAAVFTCDKNTDGSLGAWYRIGDLYTGTATVVGYVGNTATQNYGSFDTGTWLSSRATYAVSENYSYSIANGSNIKTITQARDANATNTLQTMLTQSKNVLDGKYGEYAGQAVVDLNTTFQNAARSYTINADGSVSVKSNLSRSQAIPLIKELEQALIPFESIITD